ncbi:8170_t:CDS:1, partial [Gigaspora margarita]
ELHAEEKEEKEQIELFKSKPITTFQTISIFGITIVPQCLLPNLSLKSNQFMPTVDPILLIKRSLICGRGSGLDHVLESRDAENS